MLTDTTTMFIPGEGFYAGIAAFSRGVQAKDNTFLQSMAKKNEPMSARSIEFGIDRGRITVAQEVGYGGSSYIVADDSYEMEVYKFPLFKEATYITGADLLDVPCGMHRYESWDKNLAQAYWVERKMKILYDRILVQRERMMSEMLLEGKITFTKTKSVDLKRDSQLTKTISQADKKWNHANRDHNPSKDIGDLVSLVVKKSGRRPTVAIMGNDTFEFMRQSSLLIEQGGMTYTDIRIDPYAFNGLGASWHGSITTAGSKIQIFTYDGGYKDEKGKYHYFIPDGKVLIGDFRDGKTEAEWYFGTTDALPIHIGYAQKLGIDKSDALGDISGGSVIPTHYAGPDFLQIGLQSAMLCLPRDVNAYGVLVAY